MKKCYSIIRNDEGDWETVDPITHKTTKTFKTKAEAVKAGRSIAQSGSTVIVHDSKGSVNEVLLPRRKGVSGKLLEARVKRNRSNNEVNIAIAKALNT